MHIHLFIHYVRLLGSTRFLGTMLLMLLFSLLQLDIAKTALAMPTAKANQEHIATGFFHHGGTVSTRGESPTPSDPPVALNKNTYTNVFSRLKPGIIMVPRMNRTPKPKSVYRLLARAPGI